MSESRELTVTYTEWGVCWPSAVSPSLPSGVIPVADEETARRIAGDDRFMVQRTVVRTTRASEWTRVTPPERSEKK